MSEHIFETLQREDGMAVFIEKDMGIVSGNPAQLGEIVRCRDCKYYEEVIRRCHNNPFKDSFRAFPVRNDGYCAWGVRRS